MILKRIATAYELRPVLKGTVVREPAKVLFMPERKTYSHLYKTKRWKQISITQLSTTPYCEWCLQHEGLFEAASICHHSTPHKGNEYLFYNNVFVSLCKRCHDSEAQQIERIGYSNRIGVDGWPVDVNHPSYKKHR